MNSHNHETWRLLPQSHADAQHELAAGMALMAGLESPAPLPALRWYEAAGAALVIGSGQKLSDIDTAACSAAGISVHRRASGGTAVLFSPGFLMQDIALPQGHRLHISDVSESYRWLGEVWVTALADLGLSSELVSVPEARADTAGASLLVRRACFGGRSPYEILVGGRKLIGFSQIRRRHGALLQVGIYRSWPGSALAGLLSLAPGEREQLAEELGGRVAGLAELLPDLPKTSTILAAFAAALEQRGIDLMPDPWLPAEQTALEANLARFAPIDPYATLTAPATS